MHFLKTALLAVILVTVFHALSMPQVVGTWAYHVVEGYRMAGAGNSPVADPWRLNGR